MNVVKIKQKPEKITKRNFISREISIPKNNTYFRIKAATQRVKGKFNSIFLPTSGDATLV